MNMVGGVNHLSIDTIFWKSFAIILDDVCVFVAGVKPSGT